MEYRMFIMYISTLPYLSWLLTVFQLEKKELQLKEIETMRLLCGGVTFSFRLPLIDDQNSFDKSLSSSQSSTSSANKMKQNTLSYYQVIVCFTHGTWVNMQYTCRWPSRLFSVLDSRSNGLGASADRSHCVVFLG